MDWSLQQSEVNGDNRTGDNPITEPPLDVPSDIPGTPQLPSEFMNLLSAAGLGPISRARSVSPAHPAANSTPIKTTITISSPQTHHKAVASRSPTPKPDLPNGAGSML